MSVRPGTAILAEPHPVPRTILRSGVSMLALCTVSLAAPALAQTAQTAGALAAAAQPTTTRGEDPATQDAGQSSRTTEADTAADTVSGNAIVVTGIRESLRSAQAIKRASDVVVDSVSAEDIGSLPDRSVTETLQRIPGVSISRFAAGNDPDHFSVEGSGVVVRGLTYTRSEINGRDTFTANNGRGLSFADFPSELLGGVDVFKSPSADMIEGGIAGTVNLRSRVPFDQKGLLVAGNLEMNYSDLINKGSPTIFALASNRWDTGIGEIGLLASFLRSEIYSRADGIQISNFGLRGLNAAGATVAPNDPTAVQQVYIPRGAALREQDYDRTRYGYSAAAQWRSTDHSMLATLQFLRSDSREAWTEHAVEIATDVVTGNGDARPVAGTTFDFDDDGVFTDGVITAPQGYRDDQWGAASNMRTPLEALQSNNSSRQVRQRFITDDYGANFKWDITSNLKVNLDYQHVKSSVQNIDLSSFVSTFQNADIHLNGDKLPDVNFVPIDRSAQGNTLFYTGDHQSYLDPYNSFYRSAMDHIEDSDGNEDAARIDLEYSFPEESWLTAIKAGYRFSDRENVARFSRYNWGVLSEIWGGGGPVWLDEPVNGNPGTSGGSPGPSEAFFFNDFFRGDANNPVASGRLFMPLGVLQDYASLTEVGRQINAEWRASPACSVANSDWKNLAGRCGALDGGPFITGEINPVQERTNSGYALVRFGNDFSNGMRFSGNIGVRYTQTERKASGFQTFAQINTTCTLNQAGVYTPIQFCALPAATQAAVAAFSNGAAIPLNTNLKYDYWLPSLNLKLEVGHGIQFRAAFNKTIAPPDFGLTRAYYPLQLLIQDADIIRNGGVSGNSSNDGNGVGNPLLKPIRSTNYDLTAEWYFSSVGQFTLSLFKKDLHGVLANGTQNIPFTNNGQTFNFLVNTPINSTETGKVKGFEIGYQQVYDFLPGLLSGLGLNANFTYVKSKGVSQTTLSSTDANVAAGNVANVDTSLLPLQGLSKYTINFTPFYTRGPLELRAAYSWRSKYLLTVRDVIVPFAPIMNESTGQLDASIFYAITDNVKMGIQAVNLLNERLETSQVLNNDLLRRPRSWFINDRRFTLSIRAKFGG